MIAGALAALEERFVCRPYSLRLTRSACARMYRDRQTNERANPGTDARLRHASCTGCPVGAAHLRALPDELAALTWPDGARVELAGALGSAPAPLERPRVSLPVVEGPLVPPRARELAKENSMGSNANPKTISHDGVTDTIDGWAKRLDVTPAAIRMRLKKGLATAEVLAPRQLAKPGEGKRPRQPSSPPARTAKPRPSPKRAPAPEAPSPVVAEVRALLTAQDPLELLRSLGYAFDEHGVTPNGRRLVSFPAEAR